MVIFVVCKPTTKDDPGSISVTVLNSNKAVSEHRSDTPGVCITACTSYGLPGVNPSNDMVRVVNTEYVPIKLEGESRDDNVGSVSSADSTTRAYNVCNWSGWFGSK